MNNCILSIDLGFGSTKVTFRTNEGTLRFEKFITAIAQINKGDIDVNDSNLYEFNNKYYYLFDKALKVPSDQIIQINSYEVLKSVSPVIISYIKEKYQKDLSLNFTHFAIGLSMSMSAMSKEYIKHIAVNLGVTEANIILLPQGVAAKVAYQFYGQNPEDETQISNHKSLNFLGVDIGFNTIDVFPTINGVCSTNTAKGFSNEGLVKVANSIVQYCSTIGINISPQDAKPIMETKTVYYRGRTEHIAEVVDNFAIDYMIGVIELLEKSFKNTIDKLDRMLLVGGGAALLSNYKNSPKIEEVFKQKFYSGDFLLFPEKPEFYNSLGYFKYAENLIKPL